MKTQDTQAGSPRYVGVVRHVDAGYDEAIEFAEKKGVKVPMIAKR